MHTHLWYSKLWSGQLHFTVDTVDTNNWSECQTKISLSAQLCMNHLYQILIIQVSGNCMKDKAERIKGPESWEECCGMLCSGHAMVIVLMNKLLLWLLIKLLHNIKLVTSQNGLEEASIRGAIHR